MIRKTALILAIILILTTIAAPAMAAQPRAITIVPGISFSGTTATCTARIAGNSTSEKMTATIKLWQGSTCIATWYRTGNGYIFFSETKVVTKGVTYKLTVDLTVNGTTYSTVSATGTC